MESTTTNREGSMEFSGENGFLFDERLGEAVRKHKCLYDKNEPGYKDIETTVLHAWNEVAQEVNLANGETAKRLFVNLKKRFLKKRLAFRKANGRGRSKEQLQRAKDAVDSYAFLTWLTPHIRLRETKCNIVRRQYNENFDDEDVYLSEPGDINIDDTYFDHCKEEIDDTRNSSEDATCERPTFTIYQPQERSVPQYPSPHAVYSLKKRISPVPGMLNVGGQSHVTQLTGYGGHSMAGSSSSQPPGMVQTSGGSSTTVNGKEKWTKKEEEQLHVPPKTTSQGNRYDSDCDLFGQLVSAELKTLDTRTKTILKHKIQTLIFEAKIAQLPSSSSTTSRTATQENTDPHPHANSPLQQRGSWDEERYVTTQTVAHESSSASPNQHGGYKVIAL